MECFATVCITLIKRQLINMKGSPYLVPKEEIREEKMREMDDMSEWDRQWRENRVEKMRWNGKIQIQYKWRRGEKIIYNQMSEEKRQIEARQVERRKEKRRSDETRKKKWKEKKKDIRRDQRTREEEQRRWSELGQDERKRQKTTVKKDE